MHWFSSLKAEAHQQTSCSSKSPSSFQEPLSEEQASDPSSSQPGGPEEMISVLAVFQDLSPGSVFKELSRAQMCTETSTAPASA